MEAKSAKTLGAIQPRFDEVRLLWNCLRFGWWICLASGAIFALVKLQDGLHQFLFPLNVLLLTGMLYGLLTYNNYRHYQLKVIQQMKRYPANEQWLAFSKDSFLALSSQQQEQLKSICAARGIGVLLVPARGKIRRLVSAKRKIKWFGGFLRYYSREKEIVDWIS